MLKNSLFSDDQREFEKFESDLRHEAKCGTIEQILNSRARKMYTFLIVLLVLEIILLSPSIKLSLAPNTRIILLYAFGAFCIALLSGLPRLVSKLFRVKESTNFKILVSTNMIELAKIKLAEIPAKESDAKEEIEIIKKDFSQYEILYEEDLQNQEKALDELDLLKENLKKFNEKISKS